MGNQFSLNQVLPIALTVKIGLLGILFLFIIFLLVVLKQIRSMNAIITTPLANTLTIIATILLLIGISLFIVAVIIL